MVDSNSSKQELMAEIENLRGRIDFLTNTRGRPKGLLLELEDAKASTEIRVKLGAGGGDSDEIEARLDDLLKAPAVKEVAEGASLKLSIVPGDAALDLDFEFRDIAEPNVGDYYYIRVKQVGGGLAFTSPWRVVE